MKLTDKAGSPTQRLNRTNAGTTPLFYSKSRLRPYFEGTLNLGFRIPYITHEGCLMFSGDPER